MMRGARMPVGGAGNQGSGQPCPRAGGLGIKRGVIACVTQLAAPRLPAPPLPCSSALFCCDNQPLSLLVLMASNYVDTAVEEGRFHGYGHGHGHSTTPTGATASPKTMRRSWSSASSSGHSHGHGAPKCVCAPATHAGSFKCRLHRTGSHGHSSPPSPVTAAASSSSSRTVAA